jgi:hypothetical protein
MRKIGDLTILDGKETRDLFDRYRFERDLCVSNGERERAIEQSRAAARIRPGMAWVEPDGFGFEDADFEEVERAPAIQPVSVGEAGMAVGAFIGACVAGVFAGAFVVLRAAFAPSPKRQALPKQPEYFLPTISGYPKGTYERTVKFEFHEKFTNP